jgi:tetratricopeptide (TPR) repeat protein
MNGFHRAALAAVLVATLAAYHGVLRNGFVWDDVHMIVNNRALDSLGSVPQWFTRPETTSTLRDPNFRPVLVVSFAVDVALWGRQPAGFHATNLAVHLGVVLLAYVLARRVWRNPWSALAGAALVALHPINAEAVNYVSARSSLLSTAFTLAAIAVSQPPNGREVVHSRNVLGLSCGFLALGVKETAVVLPMLIVLWDRLVSNADRPWRASLRRSLPWWALVALYLAWRTAVLAGNAPADRVGDGLWQPLLFAMKIFLTSFGSWLLPIGSAVDHGWPWEISFTEGTVLVAGALAVGGGTLAVFRFDRRIGWCVGWFWTALLPLAALPWVSRLTLYQDHRVYLAGIGLAWAGGELVRRVADGFMTSAPRRLGAGLLAAGLGSIAIAADASRTAVWRDADRLWAHTLELYPTSVLAINHQALGWLGAGETAKARDAFAASVTLAPGFAVTHNYLGVTYARLGDLDRAVAEFSSAVRISPLFLNARLNLGNAYEQLGRLDLALAAYEEGVPDQPWAVDLIERAARLLTRMNRLDEALERYRRIAKIDPHHRSATAAFGRQNR